MTRTAPNMTPEELDVWKARLRAGTLFVTFPAEVVHGKIGTYTNRGCRCEECRRAVRDWKRVQRAVKRSAKR